MRTLEAANAGQNGPAIVGLVEVGITTPTTVLRPRQAGVSEVVLVEAQHQRRRQKQKHHGYHGQESHLWAEEEFIHPSLNYSDQHIQYKRFSCQRFV